MNVVVYSTPTCGWCKRAKEFLKKNKIPFKEIDVSSNTKAAREMMALSGQTGVPVIVHKDQVIIGYDEVKLKGLKHA